jgi:hypothetical protein
VVSSSCTGAFGRHQRGQPESSEHVGSNAACTVAKHVSPDAACALAEHLSADAACALEVVAKISLE